MLWPPSAVKYLDIVKHLKNTALSLKALMIKHEQTNKKSLMVHIVFVIMAKWYHIRGDFINPDS